MASLCASPTPAPRSPSRQDSALRPTFKGRPSPTWQAGYCVLFQRSHEEQRSHGHHRGKLQLYPNLRDVVRFSHQSSSVVCRNLSYYFPLPLNFTGSFLS